MKDWFSKEENRFFENSNKNDMEISGNANSEFSSNEGDFQPNTKATELFKKN